MIGVLAVVLSSCSGGAGGIEPSSSPSSPPSEEVVPLTPLPATPLATADPTLLVTLAPSPSLAGPVISGDAATNEACALASPAEIGEQVEAGVTEVLGLTTPGAYGETGLTCTWFLDSQEVGIPSVTAQWEYPVTIWHDSVLDLYAEIVEQGLAVAVTDIGEAAMIQGATIETIDRDRIVRVTVLMHPEPTERDLDNATALLRLMLDRTHTMHPVPEG